MPDSTLFTLAAAVLAAVEDGVDDLPERRYIADGNPAHDCPQVTVRVARTFAHAGDIRVEAPEVVGPEEFRGAEVEVQVIRCSPTPTLDSETLVFPSIEAIEQSAAAVLSDAEQVGAAVRDAHEAGDLAGCNGVSVDGWVGFGPEGGLVGGTVTLRLDLA